MRDRNGGRIRIWQGTGCEPCRPASPIGPTDRAVTNAEFWSPLRTGRSRVTSRTCCPGEISTVCIRGSALALGDHASRIRPLSRRRPEFCTSRAASTVCPSLAAVSPERANTNCRVPAARATSNVTAAASNPSRPTNAIAGQGDSATGSTQISATSPARPVRITSVVPARPRVFRRARRPDWRLRVLPPAAAGYGDAMSVAPSP